MTERAISRGSTFLGEVLCVVNFVLVAYLALETWLLSGWFLDDELAARLSAVDWYRIAMQRFFLHASVGLLVVGVAFAVNRWLLRRFEPSRTPMARLIGWLSAAVVLIATITGCLQFAIRKPFL
jgi:uncharacterized membrane protein